MNNKVFIASFCMLLSLATFGQQGSGAAIETESGLNVESLNPTNKVELYPNPAVEYLVIQIKNSTLENVRFELHSIIGNDLAIQPEDLGDGKFRIQVKDYASGYYFLVVKDELARFKQAYKFLKN